ncbi:MAG: carbohydrate kinase family protein [Thermoplasmata archaeon]
MSRRDTCVNGARGLEGGRKVEQMPRKIFLGVFGHVAVDTICTVDSFPAVNTCEGIIDKRVEFGGTAGNLAFYAANMGVPTSLASFVGSDFPEPYRRHLEAAGIDLTDLVRVGNARTASIIMISDKAHRQIGFVDQGVMLRQNDMKLPRHSIEDAKIVHVGTGRPGFALRVCRRAKELGKLVAIDPAQELSYVYSAKDFSTIVRLADIFFCNETELGIALKYLRKKKPSDLLAYVDKLIVTLGKRGSRIMTREGESIDIPPARPRRVVDTTGAGDAYRAGFYAGMYRRLGLEECGMIASAAASFAVESFGGQTDPPSWEEVFKRAFGGVSARASHR